MEENIVAVQNPVTNDWTLKVDRRIRWGRLPHCLKGTYTSEYVALKALRHYREKQKGINALKHKGLCQKQLYYLKPMWWKMARAVPDIASRYVFDALVLKFKRENPEFVFPDKFP